MRYTVKSALLDDFPSRDRFTEWHPVAQALWWFAYPLVVTIPWLGLIAATLVCEGLMFSVLFHALDLQYTSLAVLYAVLLLVVCLLMVVTFWRRMRRHYLDLDLIALFLGSALMLCIMILCVSWGPEWTLPV